jgi:hypothetical protein
MTPKVYVGNLREIGPAGPVDPGYGIEGFPGRPDQGLPWGPGRPDNSLPWAPGHPSQGLPPGLGHIDNSLPGGGYVSGGPIKPPGFPTIPIDPSWGIPTDPPHPWLPGRWVPVDPGFGLPPVFGWRPVDPGYGIDVGHPGQGLPPGGVATPPIAPGGEQPSTGPIRGHWVPVDPGYGIPGCPPCNCGGREHVSGQPIWVWIPEIPPGFGIKPAPPAEPKKG